MRVYDKITPPVEENRLLIATGLYPPQMGGPATYTVFLEKQLPLHGVGFSVVPYRIVEKYPKPLQHLAYTIELIRRGRTHDILYALDTVSVGLPAMIASIVLRKPLLLRVPGDYAWEQGQQRSGITETLDEYLVNNKKPLFVRLLAWIQYRVARQATHIVVPSEYMRTVVRQWGIPPQKISRIYSALKVIDVPGSRETLRGELGYEDFVIITIARLVPWKGIQALIDAVIGLRASGLSVSLQIFGEGALLESLTQYVAEKNAVNYVHFGGVVGRDELGKHIRAADVFVLNTSYEGLSHQLLEVMSLGTPVVTTPVGGNVELITDREHGLLVPFNDTQAMIHAITELHGSQSLRATLSNNAQERAVLFHENIVSAEFVKLISRL